MQHIDVRRSIAARVRAIADWRRARAFQDLMGLGPDVQVRNTRSIEALESFAQYVESLPANDERLLGLRSSAWSGEFFDPGALVLTELGRYQFHENDVTHDQFLTTLVELAERDAEQMGRWGGPQVAGDNPWGPNWVVDLRRDPDEDEDDW